MPPNEPDEAEHDFVCLMCDNETDEMDNDVEDTDLDPHLPPGWVHITLTRVAPNAEYGVVHAAREKHIQEELAGLPVDMPPEHRQYLEHRLRSLIELIPVTEPAFRVQSFEGCLCPKHAGAPQARLAMPDWDDLDDDE